MASGGVSARDYDVVVIGGGPAGAAAGCGLANAGRRVLVLERERFPRFHIGESLLPASNRLFRALGVEEAVRRAGFVAKRGASFCFEDGSGEASIDFSVHSRTPEPGSYQVSRARFDELLLGHAAACGAAVREGHRAREVRFEAGGVRVALEDPDGAPREVSAAAVVDASGQAGFLSKRLGLRRLDEALRLVALHAHFAGVPRLEGPRAGDIRVVSLAAMGWAWLIPLAGGVTSVGLVLPVEQLPARADGEALEARLHEVAALAGPLASARRLSPVRRDADFSYAPSAYAGDRWLLAGDAGSFVDPIFSSGVLLALRSGLDAARALDAALARGDLSARAFRAFSRRQRRDYRVFRRLVLAFYDPAFRDLFLVPSNRFEMLTAVGSVLAGETRVPLLDRLRLSFLFSMAAVQRRVPLVARRHRRAFAGAPEPAVPAALPERSTLEV